MDLKFQKAERTYYPNVEPELDKKDEKEKIISKNLNRLRKMRNEANYDNTTSKPLEKMLINAKLRSKFILELLKEFY